MTVKNAYIFEKEIRCIECNETNRWISKEEETKGVCDKRIKKDKKQSFLRKQICEKHKKCTS